MGILRFVLALAVLVTHAGYPLLAGDPRLAVQIFFMISGFLISFILNRDDAYRSAPRFYVNRALRIYPIYLVVALATFLSWMAASDKLQQFGELNLPAQVLLAGSNLLLFGQDAVMFLQQQGGGLALALDYHLSDPPLWQFLLIPPAWSLSLELTFYLIAPFVVRRVNLVAVLFCLSLALTLAGSQSGLDQDPWTYRFFPFELSIFLLGVLSERLLLPRIGAGGPIAAAPAIAVFLFTMHGWLGLPEPLGTIAILGAVACVLPWLFTFQRGRKWDVFVGDLSYPLYICHWLVIAAVGRLAGALPQLAVVAGPAKIAGAIVLALMLERWIARPVERLRKRVRHQAAPVDLLEKNEPGGFGGGPRRPLAISAGDGS